ncbi:MAG TPA: glucoamylase family protein [Terriglobales bacterium]|nr:glucoamylase family protein [Terriglobales bacterium]
MVPNTQTDSITGDDARHSLAGCATEARTIRAAALELASSLSWLPGSPSSDTLSKRCQKLVAAFKSVFGGVDAAFSQVPNSEDLLWLRNNTQQLSSAARVVASELGPLTALPVVSNQHEILPRVLAIAESFFDKADFILSDAALSKVRFTEFCMVFEETTPLEFHEIGALVPALKLVLLEQIAVRGNCLVKNPTSKDCKRVVPCIRILQNVTQTSWEDELEALIPFDGILRKDPAGAFATMDVESRNVYRERVANIAQRSARSELQVAEEALSLARQAHKKTFADPRIALRESHVGYYLISEGTTLLYQRVGFHPTFRERFRMLLRRHPDEFLFFGITVLTLTVITLAVLLLTPATTSPELVLLSMLILLLPSSQAAVQLMNYLTTNLLPVDTLPKLDFSKGIPDDCVTMVAIPTLLLSENQVRALVQHLEVRYLGNHDRNIHFAIVSDLPDSDQPAPEDSSLVELCSTLIHELNERYSAEKAGSFFLLHRHRVYNPRERGWMGWERKRGKLLDLNQLLRDQFDSFPVKVGNLSILPNVRFVITLDSDTELPRGSAHRMVGAIAHPLNQAVIDPVKNIVVAGYGILQPRVGISVQCTARSRLAAIFAGETGLDPYTRAISDVYQDLYGEGTFAGKGIYEVDTMFRVLNHRFPQNALLSHDLIEGAYARAGLTTDIVVIEDYPSHYSAYNRRKHRWLRGDWQIMEWLTNLVPNESGAQVPNPISLVSRWKILDNLRRSLVEPATFALLVFGWLAMGHPILWTLVTICILFVPAWVEFAFGLIRAMTGRQTRIAREALSNLFTANLTVLLTVTLLAHQMLLSLDAVIRALVRHVVTRERLLEWETAAEAELAERQTPIDRYISWMPFLAIGLGLVIWIARPESLLAALPILGLWACSKVLVVWLNASPIEAPSQITRKDATLLRRSALYIWRYFAEFSNDEHNWLVPDNIQDEPRKVAPSISPTNLGLLLNSRQVANEFGYITTPEMVALTQKTLATLVRLPKYRGHLMNWYETHTLEPKPPFFVSSVDSGNLVASLWTLQQGCLDRLRQPLLSKTLAEGLLDHFRILTNLRAISKRELSRYETEFQGQDWLTSILNCSEEVLNDKKSLAHPEHSADIAWFREQARLRVQKVRDLVRAYMPWMLPEFSELRKELWNSTNSIDDLSLEQLPEFTSDLEARLDDSLRAVPNGNGTISEPLRHMLPKARESTLRLIEELRQTSEQAQDLASAMDFTFLLDEQRLLISVGFDAQSEELQPYFYDLLATEPRTAVFVAIAKEDIPQECWFHLDRPFTSDDGRPVLLSWTGTMFEYLMPSIWMRSYPNTLLDRASVAAVRSQQAYAKSKGIPWGISESACSKRNEAGDYHYEAFGVPNLAIKKNESEPLVVSPYSTFLALNVDRKSALRNLHRMDALGWFGPYGFYEAADFTNSRGHFRRAHGELVRSWMVHHQGMSLLSLANFLRNNVVQRWFHSDRRVQATELLLQEKPVSHMHTM